MADPDNQLRTVTVVCEKHGLRYNPQLHSGCVRCRKEAGEAIGSGPMKAPAGTSTRQGGSLAAALAVTFFLVAGTSLVFYTIHKAAWDSAQEARQRWSEEGPAELTPEEQDHLRKIQEALDSLPDR